MKKERFVDGVAVIFCAPLSQYPEQPKDISKAEPIDCPTCRQKMWMSEKKRAWKEISERIGKEILLECYDCFKKTAMENPEMFKEHVKVNI